MFRVNCQVQFTEEYFHMSLHSAYQEECQFLQSRQTKAVRELLAAHRLSTKFEAVA